MLLATEVTGLFRKMLRRNIYQGKKKEGEKKPA
jgi:hypothetical protein